MTRIIFIMTLAVFFAACDRGDSDESWSGEPLAYTVIHTSSQLRVEDPHVTVFRSWDQWSAFWAEHPECSEGCVFEVPYVDFETDMVAAMFWGLESYGCVDYAKRIESFTRNGERTHVKLGEQPLGMECYAETYAYLFVKFERADGPVDFTGVVPN